MAQDLGARLIRAGLLSRGQLARALAGGSVRGGALVAALVDDGLPEDALVGYFVSEAGATHAADAELDAIDLSLVRLVPRQMADALCALPVRRVGDAVLVVLADPTDQHAQAEMGRALGAVVIPSTARLSLLREAIPRAFERVEEENSSIDIEVDTDALFDDEPPLELVRRRGVTVPPTAPVPAEPSPYARADSSAPHRDDNRASHLGDEDAHVLLVRTKPVSLPAAAPDVPFAPGRTRTQTRDMFGGASVSPTAPPSTPAPASEPPAASLQAPDPRPAPVSSPAPAPVSSPAPAPVDDLRSADRWSTLPASPAQPASDRAPLLTPATKLPAAARHRFAPVNGALPPGALPDVGPSLATIRSAPTRDEAVRLACEAALPACRCVVFLALKRDVLQGREAVGGGVSREAVYNLWIPVTSASVFRDAITSGTAHFGPYGTTAADGIYKAAIGTTGGDALVQPVLVAGKPVAVLCGDDMRYGTRGRQRLEALAAALGEAFERLIVSHKK